MCVACRKSLDVIGRLGRQSRAEKIMVVIVHLAVSKRDAQTLLIAVEERLSK